MKLNRLSRVGAVERKSADSVKRSRSMYGNNRSRGLVILQEAQHYYLAMSRFRKDRERNKRYNYGDQWGDIVVVDGERMTEEEYILRQGNVPLKTNLIRRLVRDVVGVYRSQSTEATCVARDRDEQKDAETMSTLLQCDMKLNDMDEVYARSLEEYLISGMVVHRKWYGWRNNRMDCWTDYVQPNNFFIDTNMRDFRSWDCTCVGEIHDISFTQLCEQFATCAEDYRTLENVYSTARDREGLTGAWEYFGYGREQCLVDFLVPSDPSRCRVIEVWRKESKPRYRCHDQNSGEIYKIDVENYEEMVVRENARRKEMGLGGGMEESDIPYIKAEWFMDSFWYFYYLTPTGDILAEGETPYEHKWHPYVFKAYPFIDGEIHSFVSDVIDQQRYTNRLITLNDWVIRASAKGVLMIPEDSIPAGVTPEYFADTWAQFNGCVVYKPSKSGHVPQQVSSNSTNVGLQDMLSMQLKFFEDISGVHGALQGKAGYSGMSAALYSQQSQNSAMSLLDILESFQGFVRDCADKDIKNIQQFYDDKRILAISGSDSLMDKRSVDKIRDASFDLSVVTSNNTPAYRYVTNDFLMELWRGGAISVKQLLESGNFPFADELLQNISAEEEKMKEQQAELAQQSQGVPQVQARQQMAGQ